VLPPSCSNGSGLAGHGQAPRSNPDPRVSLDCRRYAPRNGRRITGSRVSAAPIHSQISQPPPEEPRHLLRAVSRMAASACRPSFEKRGSRRSQDEAANVMTPESPVKSPALTDAAPVRDPQRGARTSLRAKSCLDSGLALNRPSRAPPAPARRTCAAEGLAMSACARGGCRGPGVVARQRREQRADAGARSRSTELPRLGVRAELMNHALVKPRPRAANGRSSATADAAIMSVFGFSQRRPATLSLPAVRARAVVAQASKLRAARWAGPCRADVPPRRGSGAADSEPVTSYAA